MVSEKPEIFKITEDGPEILSKAESSADSEPKHGGIAVSPLSVAEPAQVSPEALTSVFQSISSDIVATAAL